MEKYIIPVNLRWSDLDPNFHLRHSVYYDYGAYCRVSFLEEHGLTEQVMRKLQFGPILFREECVFRKEVRLGDILHIDLELISARRDYSRWTIRHQLLKNNDILAAVITVDGAWIHTGERKLATPPIEAIKVFDNMPKAASMEWKGPAH